MLNFKKLHSFIYTKAYKTSVDVGKIEKQKNGSWVFVANEIGKKIYPFNELTCKTRQEMEYYLCPMKRKRR